MVGGEGAGLKGTLTSTVRPTLSFGGMVGPPSLMWVISWTGASACQYVFFEPTVAVAVAVV
jgi:hypothetical protein